MYYELLQQAISCFARNIFFLHSGFDDRIRAESLALTGDSVVLRDASGVPQLALVPTIHYRIEQFGPQRWMARNAGYTYQLEDPHEPERRFVRYDGHPWVTETDFPHVHLLTAPSGLDRLHVATGRVTLKEALTTARRDFGVGPIRDDWAVALDAADAVFRAQVGTNEERPRLTETAKRGRSAGDATGVHRVQGGSRPLRATAPGAAASGDGSPVARGRPAVPAPRPGRRSPAGPYSV